MATAPGKTLGVVFCILSASGHNAANSIECGAETG